MVDRTGTRHAKWFQLCQEGRVLTYLGHDGFAPLVPQGYGVGGSNATCISIGPKAGGLTLACRECSQSGYQPFKGASALEFWIRDQNGSSTIPDVQVGVDLF